MRLGILANASGNSSAAPISPSAISIADSRRHRPTSGAGGPLLASHCDAAAVEVAFTPLRFSDARDNFVPNPFETAGQATLIERRRCDDNTRNTDILEPFDRIDTRARHA